MMRFLGVRPIDIISTTIMTTILNLCSAAALLRPRGRLLFAATGLRLPQQGMLAIHPRFPEAGSFE